MNLETYQPYWDAVCPPMVSKMKALVENLSARLPRAMKATAPSTETNTDEFRVSANIVTSDGAVVLGMDFTLLDGDERGGDGLAISLQLTGYNALYMGGYYPHIYTDAAFTFERDELVSRVRDLDVPTMADFIVGECLSEKTLLRELAEAGVAV